ncbi:MAG TPA: hypothetical protein VEY10_12760 [Flavisolibacter sp.]|nr:hypothetical protein [Flavisolibacter sp.]
MRYLFFLIMLISLETFAGDTTKLYNPAANVKKDIAAALVKAKAQGKFVLIKVRGNWCI